MTATGHAVIGTVIAAKIGNPALAVPIAFASHFAADIFPHWDSGLESDKKTKPELTVDAAIDVLLGFATSYLMISFLFPTTNLIYVFFMIIVAQLPDWIMSPYYFFNIKIPFFMATYKFQKRFNTPLDKPWGIISQIAILTLLIIVAKSI